MIESFVDQNMITGVETSIGDYLETGQSDYSNIWKRAFTNILLDFDSMDLDVRQLCERLSLQTSVTKTAAFNGTISDEDFARRMRLVIPVSAVTGDAVFTLQGTDDGGSNYFDITLISNDGTAGTTVTISSAAIGDSANSYVLTRPYKKYRLQLISIGTTVTYTGYMIEEVYTSLHLERTIADIYKTVKATAGDNWQDKWEAYELMYRKRLAEGRFRVDYSDDNAISESESEKRSNKIRFRL